MTSLGSRLRSGVNVAIGTHLFVTLTSLGYGTGRLGGKSNLWVEDNDSKTTTNNNNKRVPAEVPDARHYQAVTNLVSNMYSGQGIQPQKQQSKGIQLAETVSFEDPAAICVGAKEVVEAFRAVSTLKPLSVTRPRIIHVEPQGASIVLTFHLNQRYGYGGWLPLQSLLDVHVELRQMEHAREFNEFVVTKLEEQWNGVTLFNNLLFWTVRRINGIVSFQVTSRLLPSPK